MDRLEAFLHYGYSREVYDSCAPNIVRHNLRSARDLSRIFFVVMAFFLLLSVAVVNSRFMIVYGMETLGFALVALVINIKPLAERHSAFISIFVSIALLSFGIASSAADNTVVATSFHVIMIIVAIFFITSLFPMIIVLGLGVAGLIGSAMVGKPEALAMGDAYNAVIFYVVALVLHYITSRDRIRSYVNLHELYETRRELAIQSHFDSLSGLFNRTRFFEVVERLDLTEDYTFCLLDVDNFKRINDHYGHHTGDLAIAGLGAAIRTTLGLEGMEGEDTATEPAVGRKTFAGRLGGDEFVMLIGPDGPDPHEAGHRIKEIMASGNYGNLHGVDISIGYASTREYPGINVDKLCRVADVKMYVQKEEHHAAH